MPSTEDIEAFKTLINALGREEEILAEKGLSIEDVSQPEPDVDNDLSTLLDESAAQLPPDGVVEEAEPPEGMDSLLNKFQRDVEEEIPEEEEEPSFLFQEAMNVSPTASGGEPEDDISVLDDLGLSGLEEPSADGEAFTEEPGIPDDFSMDALPDEDFSFEETPSGAESDLTELPDEAMDFGEAEPVDDMDLSGDLPDMDDFGDVPAAEALDDLGDADFDIPDVEQTMTSLAQAAEETSPEEEGIVLESEINLNQELGSDILDEITSDEGSDSQHFSLDDLGVGFAMDTEKGFGDNFGMEINRLEQEIGDQEEAFEEDQFEISPSELASIQKALAALPLNLKITIEELLADENLELQKFRSLINLLIRHGSPRQVANQLFKLTGKRIELPRGYEKKSGDEYEEMKRSFGYLFREQSWPLLRNFLLIAVLVWGLFALLFTVAYRPATAHHYYVKGYKQIPLDRYEEANRNFNTGFLGWNIGPIAVRGWRTKKWFYRYAEAYQGRMAFHEAARKYEELLAIWPTDKKGRLDYAVMRAFQMADYPGAEALVKGVIDQNVRDYEALLLLGDIYFKWADDDPSKLEDARLSWASILDYYGNRDEVQFRMIRYFIRTGDSKNINLLADFYRRKRKIDASRDFQAQIFGELAGFLLDTGKSDDAFFFLQKGEAADDSIPEIHYQYARYFRLIGNRIKEEKALSRTLRHLSEQPILSPRNLSIKIDTYKRIGDIHYNLITPDGGDREAEIDKAEEAYMTGISLYENGAIRNIIRGNAETGRLYAAAGDLYYFHRMDYEKALGFFEKGVKLGFRTPETDYRRGYIYYSVKKDYGQAVTLFYETTRGFPGNSTAYLALANALSMNENFHAARGNYSTLLGLLEREEASYPFLVPEEKEEHRRLLEMYKIVYNNMGVTLQKIGENAPGEDWSTEALYNLTRSSEYNDLLTRAPDTLVRAKKEHDVPGPKISPVYNTADIAYNNRMALLYPQKGIGLSLYEDLPKDVTGRD